MRCRPSHCYHTFTDTVRLPVIIRFSCSVLTCPLCPSDPTFAPREVGTTNMVRLGHMPTSKVESLDSAGGNSEQLHRIQHLGGNQHVCPLIVRVACLFGRSLPRSCSAPRKNCRDVQREGLQHAVCRGLCGSFAHGGTNGNTASNHLCIARNGERVCPMHSGLVNESVLNTRDAPRDLNEKRSSERRERRSPGRVTL